jgi:hypothetical protein
MKKNNFDLNIIIMLAISILNLVLSMMFLYNDALLASIWLIGGVIWGTNAAITLNDKINR